MAFFSMELCFVFHSRHSKLQTSAQFIRPRVLQFGESELTTRTLHKGRKRAGVQEKSGVEHEYGKGHSKVFSREHRYWERATDKREGPPAGAGGGAQAEGHTGQGEGPQEGRGGGGSSFLRRAAGAELSVPRAGKGS